MQIGPIEINFRTKKFASITTTKGELGGSGTTIYDGIISDVEYNSTLDTSYGGNGLSIYERMRKSDPVIKSALKSINLPIIQAEYFIEPASDDPKDEEIKEFVSEAFFKRLEQSWEEVIELILTYLVFGFSVFEKVFKIDEGKVWWKKFAFRSQGSIRKFQTSDGNKGITQSLIGEMIGKGGEEPSIPIEKLLIFSNEKEGDNWRGVSILRAAYKPWFFKENAEKIDMIGLERQAIGVPVFKMPPNPTQDDVDKAEELGKNLRANEKAYVLLPYKWELEILNMKGGGVREADPLIKRYNRDIYANVLAQFLDLGSGKTGSWALAKKQADPFYQSLKAVIDYICSVFNSYAIPQLVDLNYDNVKEYPKLKATGVENIDYEQFSASLQRLTMSGLITPDERLEDYVRNVLKLPDKEEQQQEKEIKQEKQEKEKEKEVEKLMKEKTRTKRFFEPWRSKTMAEEKVNLRGLQRHFDEAEEAMARELQKILSPQIDNILHQVRIALETGDPKRVEDIVVNFKEEVRQKIINQLKKSFEMGKITASNELDVLAPKNTTETINMITTRANIIADKMVDDLINKAKLNTLTYIEQGTEIETALQSLKQLLEDQIVRSSKLTSSHIVVGGVNQGRLSVFDLYPNKVYALQRSEILDNRICDFCLSMDGRVITKDDDLRKYDQFHFQCRGIWVAISEKEIDKPKIGGVPQFLRDRIGTLDEYKGLDKPIPLAGSLAEEFVKERK